MRPRRGSSTPVRYADRAGSSWTWPMTSSSRTPPVARLPSLQRPGRVRLPRVHTRRDRGRSFAVSSSACNARDLYDIHELFVVRGLDPSFVWPLFERSTKPAGQKSSPTTCPVNHRSSRRSCAPFGERCEICCGGNDPFGHGVSTAGCSAAPGDEREGRIREAPGERTLSLPF
jgi:hypothetical protein